MVSLIIYFDKYTFFFVYRKSAIWAKFNDSVQMRAV